MITTGSKFFLAVTGILGAILSLELLVHLLSPGAYVFGLDTTQAIVMASAAVACAFLGGICLAIRDGESTGSPTALVASRPHVSSSLWPAVTGVAITLMALGLVTDKRIFGLGFVALLCAGFEWVIAGWADQASSDIAHNASVRGRFLHPIEFPVLGFLIIGSVMFGFSRLMLSLNETGAIIAFAVVGTVILLAAVFMASRSGMSRNALTGVLGLGVVALVVFSVVGISRGEHNVAENIPEVEKKAANAVADKANTIASVNATAAGLEFRHDSQIVAHLQIPRALSASLMFRNDTGEKAQLVVHSVKVVTDAEGASKIVEDEFATEYIGEGKAKLLTVRIPKASTEKPYDIVVITESGKKIATTFEVK
jgi:hypothetical protein